MTHIERRIKISSFQKIQNPNLKGCCCNFDDKHFIDYKEECYRHPIINIIICKECRGSVNKLHNVPREYKGHIYHSTFEAEFAAQLDLRLRAGEIKGWEKQVKIEINVKRVNDEPILTTEKMEHLIDKHERKNLKHITNYYMDFVVTNNDESLTYYETKGYETAVWKLKWKLTEIILSDEVELEVVKKQSYKPKPKRKDK